MTDIGLKFGLSAGGPDVNHARRLFKGSQGVASLSIFENTTSRASSTTAFFTQLAASHGTQDTTNWTADTYKTLLTHTGSGLFHGVIGPTSAGADITTLRLTIDGQEFVRTVTTAASERAWFLMSMPLGGDEFNGATGNEQQVTGVDALNAGKTGFSAIRAGYLTPWRMLAMFNAFIAYKTSLLVEMKHAQSITNSTATAYSGVIHLKDA